MRIWILPFFFLIFLSSSVTFAETITLSTYYPAPQGAYNNMKIKNTWCAGTPCFTPNSPLIDATFNLYGNAFIHGLSTFKDLVQFKNNIEVLRLVTIVSSIATNTALTTNGRILASAFFHNSDQRLKENIIPIDHALEKTLSLQGVYYSWKDNPNQKKIGLIAQQVENILPEVVITNEQGLKSVAYAEIIGLLIEAIKEQQIQIDALKKQLNYEK